MDITKDVEFLKKIFPEIFHEKINKIAEYVTLLLDWNTKINLISRKDTENVILHHIVPCLSITRVAIFKNGDSVIDIGTGGGLPGMVLAITNAELEFTLLDSIKKKTVALEDIAKNLSLENVKILNDRAENIFGKFDKIVARAVTNLRDFLRYSSKLVKKGGSIFYLKGGDFTNELTGIKNYKLHNIADITGINELADKSIIEIKF